MNKYIFLGLRIVIAIILIQTLRFKLTAHPDSVFIFTQAGLEPYGRIVIGILELIAAVLILVPKTVWLGAGLTAGILAGAIFMHLTKIGIDVKGDHGTLFFMAIFTFLSSVVVLLRYRKGIPVIGKKL